jgi:RNA polymerase sigma-70 factor, ECF subfamily
VRYPRLVTAPCDLDELGRLVLAGDVAALDRMSRCFGERMLAIGRRRCGDEERARDAVQDAIVAAGTHLGDFRGEGSLEGWLLRIVARNCARMHRGRKHDPTLHDALDEDTVGAFEAERASERVELRRRLDAAIAALDPRDRALVLLADAEGWTAPEIAGHVGMTAEAVRTRLSRAHRKLREMLGDLID